MEIEILYQLGKMPERYYNQLSTHRTPQECRSDCRNSMLLAHDTTIQEQIESWTKTTLDALF